MGTIYRHFCIVSIALLVLTACSSGPPDDYLLSDFGSNDNFTNIQIVHKGKCDSISATAKALGVDDAWLVSFDYDIMFDGEIVDHATNYVWLYVKSDGEWGTGWSKFGFDSDSCP